MLNCSSNSTWKRGRIILNVIGLLTLGVLSVAAQTASETPDLPGANALHRETWALYGAGKYSEALAPATQLLDLRQKKLGPRHPDVAASLNNLALLHRQLGQYVKAKELYQRALTICEATLGPKHLDTGTTVNNLACVYTEMGDYTSAAPLYERALKLREGALGPAHPDVAASLNNLAQLRSKLGDYSQAESLYRRAVAVHQNALGPNHPDLAASLSNLAAACQEQNKSEAEPLLQRALQIREKSLGPEHPDTALSLINLTILYDTMGDYAKAEATGKRALGICERVLGPNHPLTASSLSALGTLYTSMGDYRTAQTFAQRVLKVRETILGSEHPSLIQDLNNLAFIKRKSARVLDEYLEVVELYKRAVWIGETHLRPDHPSLAVPLDNIGRLLVGCDAYEAAESFLRRALAIRRKTFDPEHPDIALSLHNLGELHAKMGDYDEAEALFKHSLQILDKTLGPEHPQTGSCLRNLAILYTHKGVLKDALVLLERVRRIDDKIASNVLSFTSEEQRLAFQKATDAYSLAANLVSMPALAETILRHKGLVIDSLLEDGLVMSARNDPTQRAIIDKVRARKQRLLQLILEIPKDRSRSAQESRATEQEKLSTEVGKLEADLARQSAGLGKTRRAMQVTVGQVQATLPEKRTLVEIVRYNKFLEKNETELCYGAVLIAVTGEPKWVSLGNAVEIEKTIALYRKAVRGETDESALSVVLKSITERVWTPIERALSPGTVSVIVSPDAELSFVSFATFLTPDDRFVGEKYAISYVASGRDLLREGPIMSGAKPAMRLFANPDFGAKGNRTPSVVQANQRALRSVEMRDLKSLSLSNLPGTEHESKQLEERAKKNGWTVQVSLGQNATEAELRKVTSPRILHLATHGFFLQEVDVLSPPNALSGTADGSPSLLVNPMHRSGLALTGAQTTLHKWAKGEVSSMEDDGIVTAEEVGGLNLKETWLVVLSACDSAGGEARAGEGVMGLRRGFVHAGGQNLLMTLWPISDETTVNIMLDFYDAAFKTGNAPQALSDTQRDWLVKLRKERGLLAAVQLAGPFIMSSQGKP